MDNPKFEQSEEDKKIDSRIESDSDLIAKGVRTYGGQMMVPESVQDELKRESPEVLREKEAAISEFGKLERIQGLIGQLYKDHAVIAQKDGMSASDALREACVELGMRYPSDEEEADALDQAVRARKKAIREQYKLGASYGF
jgi:hypothetical protein